MSVGDVSQILSLLIYLAVLVATSKGAYRIFSRHRPTRFFDPIKVSMWFVALALLYNFWVRFATHSPTLLTTDNLEWALTSLLVSTTIGALCIAVFRTERAIYDSGEP